MAVTSRVLRFGVFEVDQDSGELRRNGTKIKLQQQPFLLLVLLLSRAPELVTREELRNALWPEDTFVDFEHSVNAAIKRLRDALGDTAFNSRFVETVAGRGYRFLVPVETGNGAPAVSDAVGRDPLQQRHISRGHVVLIAAALLVFVSIIGFGWLASWRRAKPQTTERRLTANMPDLPVIRAVLSPDGKYLAYADRLGMYFEQIDTGEVRRVRLPGGMEGVPSGWFPDSTRLLFTTAQGSSARSLWTISVMGGEPRKMLDGVSAASVSPDGKKTSLLRQALFDLPQFDGTTVGKELWVMNSDGEDAKLVVKEDPGDEGDFQAEGPAVWSPDSRSLAFVHATYNGSSLLVRDLDRGTTREIATDPDMGLALGWSPDGRILYSVFNPRTSESVVWSVKVDAGKSVASGAPRRVTAGPGFVSALSMSADGKKLAVTRMSSAGQVYVAEFNEAHDRLSTPRRLTNDLRGSFPTAWTPDSISVLFFSMRSGVWDIYRQGIDEATAERIVESKQDKVLPRVSPDGKTLMYVTTPRGAAFRTGSAAVYRWMKRPLAGGETSAIRETFGFSNLQCSVKPANVCLADRREKGKTSFAKVDLERGVSQELFQVPSECGFNWSLSADASKLAMIDMCSEQLSFRRMSDGATRAVSVKDWPHLSVVDWRADGKGIVVPSVAKDGSSVLLSIDEEGNAKELLRAEKNVAFGPAVSSPDGRRVVLREDFGESNVWLVENF